MTLIEWMRWLSNESMTTGGAASTVMGLLPALLDLCEKQHAALVESERGGDWADYAGHACCPWCGGDATAAPEPVTHAPQCKVGEALALYSQEIEP